MKEPRCSFCREYGHYKINCFKAPRAPIKSAVKPLKRTPIARSATKTAIYPSKPKPLNTKPVARRKQLIQELDTIFSRYIRMKESIDGVARCVTCGVRDSWKNLHACHYISRRYIGTRFNEKNVHPGCYKCNVVLNGNLARYKVYLQKRYGVAIIDELDTRKKKNLKNYEIEALIKHYKNGI